MLASSKCWDLGWAVLGLPCGTWVQLRARPVPPPGLTSSSVPSLTPGTLLCGCLASWLPLCWLLPGQQGTLTLTYLLFDSGNKDRVGPSSLA